MVADGKHGLLPGRKWSDALSASCMFCPSLIMAIAVYVTFHDLGKTPIWTETLKHYTGYSEDELKECAKMAAKESKLKGVHRKFSSIDKGVVSLLPPTMNLNGQ